jgi:hypothetical protein
MASRGELVTEVRLPREPTGGVGGGGGAAAGGRSDREKKSERLLDKIEWMKCKII